MRYFAALQEIKELGDAIAAKIGIWQVKSPK